MAHVRLHVLCVRYLDVNVGLLVVCNLLCQQRVEVAGVVEIDFKNLGSRQLKCPRADSPKPLIPGIYWANFSKYIFLDTFEPDTFLVCVQKQHDF